MIEQYVSELIGVKDEVVIPGFGAFVAVLVESKVVGTDILPPNKKISFYPRLQQDKNNVLKNAVMAGEAISEQDFETHLTVFIQRLNHSLDNHGRAEIPNLGVLVKLATGELEFTQDGSLNFLPDAYGLPKLVRTPLGVKSTTKAETSQATKDETPPTTPVAETTTASATTTNTTKNTPQKAPSDSRWIWVIIIPVLLVFAFLIYYFTSYNTRERNLSDTVDNTVDVMAESEKQNPETEAGEAQNTDDNGVSQQTEPLDLPEEERLANHSTADKDEDSGSKKTQKTTLSETVSPNTSSATSGTFTISIASYDQEAAAQKALKKFKNEGLDCQIMSANGIYRITVGQFSSQESAKVRCGELKGKYKGAWVVKL